jgi:hypothetical protein
MPLLALALSTRGRTVEKAAVRWLSVDVSGVPACPIGKAANSSLPRYFLISPVLLLGFLRELDVAAEMSTKADLDDYEGAVFLVEGERA